MLRDGDELRVFHATGKGRALPTVVDLAFVTFVHNILNQVARTGRHNLGASVGTTKGGGEDFDCFRFVHTSMMAQNRAKIKRSCATLPTGFFTLLSTHICPPLNDIFDILIRSMQSDKLLRLYYT